MSQTASSTMDYLALEDLHGAGTYRSRGLTLVRGEGACVYDEQGREYLDCTAAYGVASLGHSHPKMVAALREQVGRLIDCTGSFANDQRARYLSELTALLPAGMTRVFLCNSGTEATEGALKFARLSTGRTGVIACMRGFHGRTMGALSATWDQKYREPFAPLVPGFSHIPYNKLEALDEAVSDETAAVIFEVVQGEGGVRPGTEEFLRGAQQICRDRGAMLVLDEVQTGFGRTGSMFAFERFGLEPDLLCLAKGMAGGVPMGAVVIGPRIGELPVGAHGSTFGGNPLACTAARTVLEVFAEEGLVARAEENGRYLVDRLAAIENPRVREVRGAGMLVGMELKERVAPYVTMLQDRGILALNAGPSVLRLLPPLIIEREQIDRAVQAIAEVLEEGASE